MKLLWRRILTDYPVACLEETRVVSTENILRIASITLWNTLQVKERGETPLPSAGTVRSDKITLQWRNNLALTDFTVPYEPSLAVMVLQGTEWSSQIAAALRGWDVGEAKLALIWFYALLIPVCTYTATRSSTTPRFYNLSTQLWEEPRQEQKEVVSVVFSTGLDAFWRTQATLSDPKWLEEGKLLGLRLMLL